MANTPADLSRYTQMLKVGGPEAFVILQMTQDGIPNANEKIIEAKEKLNNDEQPNIPKPSAKDTTNTNDEKPWLKDIGKKVTLKKVPADQKNDRSGPVTKDTKDADHAGGAAAKPAAPTHTPHTLNASAGAPTHTAPKTAAPKTAADAKPAAKPDAAAPGHKTGKANEPKVNVKIGPTKANNPNAPEKLLADLIRKPEFTKEVFSQLKAAGDPWQVFSNRFKVTAMKTSEEAIKVMLTLPQNVVDEAFQKAQNTKDEPNPLEQAQDELYKLISKMESPAEIQQIIKGKKLDELKKLYKAKLGIELSDKIGLAFFELSQDTVNQTIKKANHDEAEQQQKKQATDVAENAYPDGKVPKGLQKSLEHIIANAEKHQVNQGNAMAHAIYAEFAIGNNKIMLTDQECQQKVAKVAEDILRQARAALESHSKIFKQTKKQFDSGPAATDKPYNLGGRSMNAAPTKKSAPSTPPPATKSVVDTVCENIAIYTEELLKELENKPTPRTDPKILEQRTLQVKKRIEEELAKITPAQKTLPQITEAQYIVDVVMKNIQRALIIKQTVEKKNATEKDLAKKLAENPVTINPAEKLYEKIEEKEYHAPAAALAKLQITTIEKFAKQNHSEEIKNAISKLFALAIDYADIHVIANEINQIIDDKILDKKTLLQILSKELGISSIIAENMLIKPETIAKYILEHAKGLIKNLADNMAPKVPPLPKALPKGKRLAIQKNDAPEQDDEPEDNNKKKPTLTPYTPTPAYFRSSSHSVKSRGKNKNTEKFLESFFEGNALAWEIIKAFHNELKHKNPTLEALIKKINPHGYKPKDVNDVNESRAILCDLARILLPDNQDQAKPKQELIELNEELRKLSDKVSSNNKKEKWEGKNKADETKYLLGRVVSYSEQAQGFKAQKESDTHYTLHDSTGKEVATITKDKTNPIYYMDNPDGHIGMNEAFTRKAEEEFKDKNINILVFGPREPIDLFKQLTETYAAQTYDQDGKPKIKSISFKLNTNPNYKIDGETQELGELVELTNHNEIKQALEELGKILATSKIQIHLTGTTDEQKYQSAVKQIKAALEHPGLENNGLFKGGIKEEYKSGFKPK